MEKMIGLRNVAVHEYFGINYEKYGKLQLFLCSNSKRNENDKSKYRIKFFN